MRKWTWKSFLPVLVLVLAGVIVAGMMATRQPPARSGGPEVPARLVRTALVERTPQRIEIEATGTVIPAESVVLQPQITGRVVSVSDQLEPGAVVDAGDILVRIEKTDFEAAVAEAEAQLAQARAELALERGRSDVAQAEFEQFAKDLDVPVDEALAQREPQLAAARAGVQRAESVLARARANLERTTLRAPFRALVSEKSVNLGAQVGPQSQLAQLVAVDRYWVQATLPIAHLEHIAVPGFNAERGAEARVVQDAGFSGAARPVHRSGEVVRLFGSVTPQGRLAQLLVRVPDPRALGAETRGLPLLLDAFVEVQFEGREQRDLIRMSREYLRENDQVWVIEDGKLDIRTVDIVWRAPDHVLIEGGLRDGERIVTSPLSNPVNGLRLKRSEADNE